MHTQVTRKTLVQRYLPKQTDLQKILKIIQSKVLKGTHLPIAVKEIQAIYLVCPYFKDVYWYSAGNKLPQNKSAMGRTETQAKRCFY